MKGGLPQVTLAETAASSAYANRRKIAILLTDTGSHGSQMITETQLNRIRDVREYIEALSAIKEVQTVDEPVDLEEELGAIIRHSYELRAPAPLFRKINGITNGFQVLGAPAGVSAQAGLFLARIAVSLGLPAKTSGAELIERLAAARLREPVPAREVATATFQENVETGDEIDLTRFPAPLLHGGDGGRYINTFGCIVVQSPDGSWTNWSIARIMLLDRNRMTGIVKVGQHLGDIHKMWADQGKDTPFALALGVEPAIPFVCGMPIPSGVDEGGYLGAYFGEAIDVVRCKTVNLAVPASAEIVIEGHISATELHEEGPMGEYAGYNWRGVSSPKPVYHVTAVSYRHGAILPVAVAGEPIEEDHTAWGLPNAAEALYTLRRENLPVTLCWNTLEAANHWMVVTVPKDWRDHGQTSAEEFCRRIGEALFSGHAGGGLVKVLVMEDDVDATDTLEVLWAFATRAHPGSSEIVFEHKKTGALSVFLDDNEKRTMTSTKSVHNCLTRDEWTGGNNPSRTSLRRGYSPQIVERVLSKWNQYGYTTNGDRT